MLFRSDVKVIQKSVNLLPSEDKNSVAVEVIWECIENVAVPQLITDVGAR